MIATHGYIGSYLSLSIFISLVLVSGYIYSHVRVFFSHFGQQTVLLVACYTS
jgi:hypothetical protein